jgi:hypothetical protein
MVCLAVCRLGSDRSREQSSTKVLGHHLARRRPSSCTSFGNMRPRRWRKGRRGVLRANSNTHHTRVSVAIYSEAVPVTCVAMALGYIAVRRATTSFDPLVTLMYQPFTQRAYNRITDSDSNTSLCLQFGVASKAHGTDRARTSARATLRLYSTSYTCEAVALLGCPLGASTPEGPDASPRALCLRSLSPASCGRLLFRTSLDVEQILCAGKHAQLPHASGAPIHSLACMT